MRSEAARPGGEHTETDLAYTSNAITGGRYDIPKSPKG